MKVGFLFNHYVAYQVQHGAPYAFQLSRLRPDYQVEILCSTDEAVEEVKRVGRHYPGSRCSVRNLKSSVIARILTHLGLLLDCGEPEPARPPPEEENVDWG